MAEESISGTPFNLKLKGIKNNVQKSLSLSGTKLNEESNEWDV